MTSRNRIWDALGSNPSEPDVGPAVHDAGILLPDDHHFQFNAVDDASEFGAATTSLPASAETQTSLLPLDELSALYPGIVWPSLFGETSPVTDDGGLRPDTPSQNDAGTDTVQGVSAAAIDWRLTPDFDDDPGWSPGVVWPPQTERAASVVGEIASAPADSSALSHTGIETTPAPVLAEQTSALSTDAAPVEPRDETATSSLTLADLSALYPGAVWPADWYLL